jgi:uncharacterized protein YigE (DUF2233 family)
VLVARFDPTQVFFRVHYAQGSAGSLTQWLGVLPSPMAVFNASFFTPQYQALGLLVSDNAILSRNVISNRSDTGTFQVKAGAPKVRSNWLEPYTNADVFEQAVQAYPILMARGQVAPINTDVASVVAARSVVAMDRNGRILLLATSGSGTKLADFGAFLGQSGLNIDTALNLDGGNSTNLYLATGGNGQVVQGFSAVPAVIGVYSR